MNLANPLALVWAGLLIPVLVFYILKIRLRRVPVSTVIFWRQIFEEKKPRSLWQRLRHLLSLLVQLALLLLLIFALAQPFFASEANEARRVVLVIDNSASMNATDVTPSRLAAAKELALKTIDGLRHRDEMAIVVAGTQPRVVCGLTGHQRTLREQLNAVPPTDGPTKLTDAVALARRLIADAPDDQKKGHIIVGTDGRAAGIEELVKDETVKLLPVGTKAANVGITRFQVRRSLLDPTGYEILAEVANHSDEPVNCRLEIELNGRPVDVHDLKLEANGKWSQVMEQTSTDGGHLKAILKYDDALQADNTAVAILPKREFQPVLLVTPEPNLFLEKVFEANSLAKLTVAREPPTNVAAGTILVYHRKVPEKLPAGLAFVIDPTTATDLWQVGDKLQNALVTQQDKDSPLMANLRLDNVLMPEARKLTFPGERKPAILAAALTGEPLYVAIDRPEGKVLVLTVNLDQGDLPLRTAFPIMASNALQWFSGNRGELRESLATGATTEVTLPAGGDKFLLRSPDGNQRELPAGVTKTTVGPLDKVGVWTVTRDQPDAPPVVELACNLANAAESDIRVPDALTGAEVTQTGFAAALSGRPMWFYLLFVAFLLAAAEWYLYQRRWIS